MACPFCREVAESEEIVSAGRSESRKPERVSDEARQACFTKLQSDHLFMHECNLGSGVICDRDNFNVAIAAAWQAGAAAMLDNVAKEIEQSWGKEQAELCRKKFER